MPDADPQDFDPSREIAPRDLKAALDAGDEIDLIDCRLPREREITHIGGRLIPLQELPARFESELKGGEAKRVVVYCRSGRRSLDFVDALRRAGFQDAKSLAGGVNRWNTEVEPNGVTY